MNELARLQEFEEAKNAVCSAALIMDECLDPVVLLAEQVDPQAALVASVVRDGFRDSVHRLRSLMAEIQQGVGA